MVPSQITYECNSLENSYVIASNMQHHDSKKSVPSWKVDGISCSGRSDSLFNPEFFLIRSGSIS